MPHKDPKVRSAYVTQWALNRKLEWMKSQGGVCCKCGSTERLEVDHVDPSTKVTHRIWHWSDERRAEELAKCQVLCRSCHLVKTAIDLSKPLVHGTSNAYNQKKCRCDECKLWDSEDEKAYRIRAKLHKLSMED